MQLRVLLACAVCSAAAPAALATPSAQVPPPSEWPEDLEPVGEASGFVRFLLSPVLIPPRFAFGSLPIDVTPPEFH